MKRVVLASWAVAALAIARPGAGPPAAARAAPPSTAGETADSLLPDAALFQVILEVGDMARQVAFYGDTLGLRMTYPQDAAELSNEPFVRFATPGGASLALHAHPGPDRFAGRARLSFMTHDLVGRRKELLERDVGMGPMRHPAPGVLVSDGRDPEGNVFHLETRVRPPAADQAVKTGAWEAFDAWIQAYNAAEWDRFLDFYADDPRFHLHEAGRVLYTSKDSVGTAIRELYESVTEARLTVDETRLAAVSDRLVLITTGYEQRLVLQDGTPLAFSGTMHLLIERGSEGWRVLGGDTITED